MIVIWSLCLVLTLLVVTVLVRRIVRPLRQQRAHRNGDGRHAAELPCAVQRCPPRDHRLADNYEDLLQRLSLSWSHQRQFGECREP